MFIFFCCVYTEVCVDNTSGKSLRVPSRSVYNIQHTVRGQSVSGWDELAGINLLLGFHCFHTELESTDTQKT